MLEALEKFRNSESGKIAFYIFVGLAAGLFLMFFAAPSKVSMFSNNGNDNSAAFSANKYSKKK